jgi:hypothetical protein
MSDVDPDDLRFEYRPFDKPLHDRQTITGGDVIDFVKRGVMRATWDSPEGPVFYMWAVEDDLTEMYEAEPALRAHVAELVVDAYDKDERQGKGA